jgi:hypothetical protein
MHATAPARPFPPGSGRGEGVRGVFDPAALAGASGRPVQDRALNSWPCSAPQTATRLPRGRGGGTRPSRPCSTRGRLRRTVQVNRGATHPLPGEGGPKGGRRTCGLDKLQSRRASTWPSRQHPPPVKPAAAKVTHHPRRRNPPSRLRPILTTTPRRGDAQQMGADLQQAILTLGRRHAEEKWKATSMSAEYRRRSRRSTTAPDPSAFLPECRSPSIRAGTDPGEGEGGSRRALGLHPRRRAARPLGGAPGGDNGSIRRAATAPSSPAARPLLALGRAAHLPDQIAGVELT